MSELSSVAGPRVAVDVGGTFIDFVMLDPSTGQILVDKQASTPDALAEELMEGLSRLPRKASELTHLFHGSTVAINAIVQERGARVGLVTTTGFRDVLEIGRGNRPEIDNWLYVPPEPLVPRYLRAEVRERTAPDGSEVEPLDLDQLDKAVTRLVDEGIESLAVAFLNSYSNPLHERQAVERVREMHPKLHVTASSDISTEWHEFERTSSAVLNAYIQPLFGEYIEEVATRLRAVGYSGAIPVMQSNGGVIQASRAAELPIRTVQSGPAGGVIGAQAIIKQLGTSNAICTDVGGTTFDVAIIQDGEIAERNEMMIGGRPVIAPSIDIVSVGAGGGSIAWLDDAGGLRVGPQSAGARPGPVCFGRGGAFPTVTDCHLILGRLDAGTFLGSRMSLDLGAARDAVWKHLAEPLGMDIETIAHGVLTIAEANMSNAIREMVVRQAVDPRDFTIFAYGGGGGLFAVATAEEVGAANVVVPRGPATFSAWGILASDYREDAARTRVRPLTGKTAQTVIDDAPANRAHLAERIAVYGFDDASIDVNFQADLRFEGQEHTITVGIDESWFDEGADQLSENLIARFADQHFRIYGHGDKSQAVELVTIRGRAVGRNAQTTWPAARVGDSAASTGSRDVAFSRDRGFESSPIFDRDSLAAGQRVEGPALIEEWNTTLLVPPGWQATVQTRGELLIERNS